MAWIFFSEPHNHSEITDILNWFRVLETLASNNVLLSRQENFQISLSRMVLNTYAHHNSIHNQMDNLSDLWIIFRGHSKN